MSAFRRLYWACAIAITIGVGYLDLNVGFDLIKALIFQ